MASTNISDPMSFESEASLQHQKALFNPIPDVREQALKEIRANSAFEPDHWQQLDAAAGVSEDEDKEELTADSSLTVDSWAEYSTEILNEQFVQSTVVDMLLGAGYGVSSSLARYAYISPLRNVSLEADVSMNARSRSRQDMPSHGLDGVPLPIVHTDYEIDSREYQNAQAFGESFDASVGTEARRANNRREAQMLWDGWGGEIQTERGVFTVGGLDTDSDKILQASSTGWVNDPDGILADFNALHNQIEDQTDVEDEDDVPLVSEVGARVFVPRSLWGEVTREDYESSATDEPLIDRLNRKYSYLDITPAPRLDSDSAVMMLNDPRYFQIVNAQSPTNTSWDVDGGHGLRNKLISSRVPFVRRQPDGIRGIVRMTGINA